MKFKTKAELEAMIGQTYGTGKDARTVTRISGISSARGSVMIYWKRPGGKERRVGKYLPYFLDWIRKTQRTSNRKDIESVADIEEFTSKIPELSDLTGFIEQDGNEVTIRFTIK